MGARGGWEENDCSPRLSERRSAEAASAIVSGEVGMRSTNDSHLLLLKVEGVFRVQGRGLVLQPGLSSETGVRAGERLELRRPDGSTVKTSLVAVELLCGPGKPCTWVLMLPHELTDEAVPAGTEIWRVRDQHASPEQ